MQIRIEKASLLRLVGQILVSLAVVLAFNFLQQNQSNSNNRSFTSTEFNGKTPAFKLVGDCEKPGGC